EATHDGQAEQTQQHGDSPGGSEPREGLRRLLLDLRAYGGLRVRSLDAYADAELSLDRGQVTLRDRSRAGAEGGAVLGVGEEEPAASLLDRTEPTAATQRVGDDEAGTGDGALEDPLGPYE